MSENVNGSIEEKSVINLCPVSSDSKWIAQNAKCQIKAKTKEKIKEKLDRGEANTLFLRASDNTIEGLKLMGKLLVDCSLKEKGCSLILIEDNNSSELVDYTYQRLKDILKMLNFKEKKYSLEGVDYSLFN